MIENFPFLSRAGEPSTLSLTTESTLSDNAGRRGREGGRERGREGEGERETRGKGGREGGREG